MLWRLGDLAGATERFLTALEIAEREGNLPATGAARNYLGIIAGEMDRFDRAREHFEAALEIARSAGTPANQAATLGNLGAVYRNLGDLDRALEMTRESLSLQADSRSLSAARSHHNLGLIHMQRGSPEMAREAFEASLDIKKEKGDLAGSALTLVQLGLLDVAAGQAERAVKHLQDALRIARETGTPAYQREALEGLAKGHAARGDFASAYATMGELRELEQAYLDEARARDVSRLEVLHGVAQREQAIALLEQQAVAAEAMHRRDQARMALLAVSSLAIIAVLVLLALAFRSRRQAERQGYLRELEIKRNLAAMLVHDMRSPLTAIMGSAEMIADDPTSPRTPVWAARIDEAAQNVSRLTSELLEFTRLETEAFRLQPQPCRLEQVAARSAGILESLASARNVVIRIQERAPAMVLADDFRVGQVITNIVANAIRHSPPGSVIDVSFEEVARDGRPFLRCCIHDQGPGVTPERAKAIFDSFVSDERSAGREGIGLGLAVSRLIIRAHGGEIGVENEPARPGASFYFELPQAG